MLHQFGLQSTRRVLDTRRPAQLLPLWGTKAANCRPCVAVHAISSKNSIKLFSPSKVLSPMLALLNCSYPHTLHLMTDQPILARRAAT